VVSVFLVAVENIPPAAKMLSKGFEFVRAAGINVFSPYVFGDYDV
jgi:hypothetical protein